MTGRQGRKTLTSGEPLCSSSMFVYVSMFIDARVYARHRAKKNSPGGGKFSENPGKYFKQLADDLVLKFTRTIVMLLSFWCREACSRFLIQRCNAFANVFPEFR